MRLYHATSQKNLSEILSSGAIKHNSYWSCSPFELMRYYMETIEDEGEVPVVLVIDTNDTDILKPDMPGLYEPISCASELTDEEIWTAWEASSQNAQACIDLIDSVVIENSVISSRILSYPELKPIVQKKNIRLEP